MLGVPVPRQADLLTWKGSDRATDDSVIFDHVFPHQRFIYLPLIADNLTIVPLRHPYLTQKSWQDRGYDLADLIAMWEVMVFDIDPLEPYYLPIDVPDRDDYLQEINNKTKLRLETDWTPKGEQKGNSATMHRDVRPTPEIAALCERIKPFLDRFYS